MSLEADLARSSLSRFVRLAWRHTDLVGNPKLAWNWHIPAVCSVLEDVTFRRTRSGVVNVPPSTGKSILSGIFWPAWVWTFDPAHRWIYASYGQELLNRDTTALFSLLRSEWYRDCFGDMLEAGKPAVGSFSTRGGGGRRNVSIRGGVTGWHCNTLVIDDPHKAQDALKLTQIDLDFAWAAITNSLCNRTLDPRTFAKLMICQRIAPRDASQNAIEAGWRSVSFPMLFDPLRADPLDPRTSEGEPLFETRFGDVAELHASMEALGTWDAQYQQNPSGATGATFKPWQFDESCWIGADELPAVEEGTTIQSWDLTVKGKETSDWIAGQWWTEKDGLYFHRGDPVFCRASFTETLGLIQGYQITWPAYETVIEDKANAPAIEDVLKETIPITLSTPEGSKVARAVSISPLLGTENRRGKVRLARGSYIARWRSEWPGFPRMRRDDEIDAASQALRHLAKNAGYFAALEAMSRP